VVRVQFRGAWWLPKRAPGSLLGVVVSRWPLIFSALHPNLRDPYPSLGAFPTHVPVFLACKAQCSPDTSVMFFLGHSSVLTVQLHRRGPRMGWSQGRGTGGRRRGSSYGWGERGPRVIGRFRVEGGFRLGFHWGRRSAGPCFLFLLDLPRLEARVQPRCSVL